MSLRTVCVLALLFPFGLLAQNDTALAIAKQIEAGTSSATVHVGQTGFLGVEVVPTSQLRGGSSNGGGSETQGALVGGALPGYPAARIGLAQGDVITSVDGQAVTTPSGLTARNRDHSL